MSQSLDGFTWQRLGVPPQPAVKAAPLPGPTAPNPRPAGPSAGRLTRSAMPWAGIGLGALIVLWVVLGLYGLGRVGYPNQYYAAAVLSMTESWKAFFFGAIDSAAFITVDKPPFALWVQALSARAFGFSTWSIMLPEALAGLGTVLAVYHLTRRRFGALAATLAGLVLLLTPIAVAVNRVNIPDAILVLLLVGGAWGTLAAIRSGRLAPLLVGAALAGLGFNTKMLQAYIVVPAFVLTYIVAAPGSLRRRILHLLAAGAVLAAVSASWMLVVDAIPPELRPYIGGSADNSVLNLVLGYNGLGRILGRANIAGTIGELSASAGGANFGGTAGSLRLFNTQLGGQIGWLLPLAAASLVAGLLARGRQGRTDEARAWYLLWGGWLVTHALVFSFAAGGFHPYYTVAMAPAVAALCGPGIVVLWGWYRRGWATAWMLPLALGGTAALGVSLIGRSASLSWLQGYVVAGILVAVLGLLIGRLLPSGFGRTVAVASLVLGLAAVLIGPGAWSASTIRGQAGGGDVLAGPSDALAGGRMMGGPPPDGFAGAPRPDGEQGGPPQGRPGSAPGIGRPDGAVDASLLGYLEANRGQATYLVAVNGSMQAAPLILGTGGEPVMSMGGFNGGDPAPTVAQLQALVTDGTLRFVLVGGRGGPGGGTGDTRTQWIQTTCSPVDPASYGSQAASTGGQQLYDCAAPALTASAPAGGVPLP